MQPKNEISEELRSLSVMVDEISRQMPYGLPEGYFDDFAMRVVDRITGIEGMKGVGSPFQVPEGYFDGFAGGVLARIKAGNAAMLRSEAAEELALLSPLLSGMERKAPYQAPEGYFGELAPILAGLQHKSLYKVPEGYFDGLAGKIAARVTEVPAIARHTPARVVSFGRRGWWKYSAAAVVAGLILTIGWLRLHTGNGRNAVPTDVAHSLYAVSDQEIQNYLDNHNVTPLAEPDSIVNSNAALNVDENDVKSLLGDVPDGELKQYLEEHGGEKDVATN
ncbi:MAG TPA: hypothetical protein VGM30_15265 [Puia sp.]|jgi:hypothetical protein